MRLCHNCACAQHQLPGLGTAPEGEMNLLCYLTSMFLSLGGCMAQWW